MIITIDGPAGTGKSTVARKVAEKLGFSFFDTGAMYRAVTYQMIKEGISKENISEIKNLLKNFHFKITQAAEEKHYWVNECEVSKEIRMPNVNGMVSDVAALSLVREALVDIQRNFAKEVDAVFEGRDMGTVVFPNADLKIYLDAEPLTRADRRYKEYIEKHPEVKLNKEDVLKELIDRDTIDSSRAISPLRKAEGAYLIDTTHLTIEEVVQKVILLVSDLH